MGLRGDVLFNLLICCKLHVHHTLYKENWPAAFYFIVAFGFIKKSIFLNEPCGLASNGEAFVYIHWKRIVSYYIIEYVQTGRKILSVPSLTSIPWKCSTSLLQTVFGNPLFSLEFFFKTHFEGGKKFPNAAIDDKRSSIIWIIADMPSPNTTDGPLIERTLHGVLHKGLSCHKEPNIHQPSDSVQLASGHSVSHLQVMSAMKAWLATSRPLTNTPLSRWWITFSYADGHSRCGFTTA